MTQAYDVLIVGAGHAGAATATALRQRGFDGSIALVGDEADPPYERPPLSKEYLTGAKPFDRLLIRPLSAWRDRNVDLLLGAAVVEIDAGARRVRLGDGRSFGYGALVWAAGGRPRRLSCPGHDLAGLHYVRTRGDVDRLMAELATARRAVIVGGGYIGLETAAALSTRGLSVTVLEAAPRVLARVAGVALSRFYEAEHRARGVDLRTDAAVERIEGSGRVESVRLSDGRSIPADIVVVGIGILANVEPLLAAGAAGGDGVDVDEFCRTTLSHVFAAGDCARHPNAHADGAVIRLESVQNANDQAATVAGVLTGASAPYRATPWFWSNQYDLRLQTVGLSAGHDEAVLRGDPGSRSFSVVYRRRGRVVALDCVNRARDFIQGRALVEAGARVDDALLADDELPLKSLLPPPDRSEPPRIARSA